MAHLWKTRRGRLSYQVLHQFYVTVTEKLDPGLNRGSARRDVQSLFAWVPVPVDGVVIVGARQLQDRDRLSWWDSLIVSAAQVAGCPYLLTEDLQDDRVIGDVRIVNPFRRSPEDLI